MATLSVYFIENTYNILYWQQSWFLGPFSRDINNVLDSYTQCVGERMDTVSKRKKIAPVFLPMSSEVTKWSCGGPAAQPCKKQNKTRPRVREG